MISVKWYARRLTLYALAVYAMTLTLAFPRIAWWQALVACTLIQSAMLITSVQLRSGDPPETT